MSDNAQTKGLGGLKAFDQLPPRVRKALADFPVNMSAEYALSLWRRGYSEDEIILRLEQNRPRQPA